VPEVLLEILQELPLLKGILEVLRRFLPAVLHSEKPQMVLPFCYSNALSIQSSSFLTQQASSIYVLVAYIDLIQRSAMTERLG